jgi:ribose transport system permease protein
MVLRMNDQDGVIVAGAVASGAKDRSIVNAFISAIFEKYATLFLLVILIVGFSFATNRFFTTENLTNLLVVQAVISCVAFAAIIPLIAGEFDLSLGNMIGFLAMLGAVLGAAGYGAVVVVSTLLVASVICGLVNGALTVKFEISSFIATLGTGILLSGFTFALSNGQVIFSGVPEALTYIGQEHFLGLGITVWLTILIALVLLYVTEHTPFGTKLYAIGGSERVAFLAGIRTGLLKIIAFAVAGLLVGIGAIFALGQNGAANPGYGPDLLLPAYAAAFLGVTSYRPGYYNIPGAIIAILLLAVGFNGLNLLGAPFWVQPIFNGAVLIVAVVTARAEARHIKK